MSKFSKFANTPNPVIAPTFKLNSKGQLFIPPLGHMCYAIGPGAGTPKNKGRRYKSLRTRSNRRKGAK